MRDESIPAWTTLRGEAWAARGFISLLIPSSIFPKEPSSSSAAPSEDELLEQSSQPSMVRGQGSRPSAPARRPDGAPGPSGSRSVSGRGVGGVGPSGSQALESAGMLCFSESSTSPPRPHGMPASRHSKPDSSSRTRRPLSLDSEEEVEQPKKKKKKIRILDPDKDDRAAAQTRVPPPTQSRRASYTSTSTLSRNTRRLLDIGSPERESGGSTDRQKPSTSRPSAFAPNRPAPTSSASARQLPRTAGPKASVEVERASSTGNRRHSAPVAPSQHEVIEILDSDDEYVPPPKASPPPPKQPSPKSTSDLPLPRRRTIQPKKVPTVAYKEENGIIILDDSDDDEVVVPPPPATQASTSQRKNIPTPPTAASAAETSASPRKDASPVRRSPSVVAFVRSPSPSQPTSIRASPTSIRASPTSSVHSPEQASSPPVAVEQADVFMLDDDPAREPPEDTMADVEMHDDVPEDVLPLEESQQGTDEEQTPPADEPVAQTDIPIPVASTTELDSSSPPGEEPPTREGTAAPETASSTLRTVSTPELGIETESSVAPVVASPQPSSLAGVTKALITRLSSVVLSAEPDPVREGTASPVSSMLDPRLQDLAISGSSASPAQSSNTNPSGPYSSLVVQRQNLMLWSENSPSQRFQSAIALAEARICISRSSHTPDETLVWW